MMKKVFSLFIASLLIATTSCTKEETSSEITNDSYQKVSALSFIGERPQFDDDTRTSWNGSAIVWTADVDKIKVGFTFGGSWWAQTSVYKSDNASPNNHIKFYQSDAVSIDNSDASIGTFSVPTTFTGPTEQGDFVFYAVYPSSAIENNNQDEAPVVDITLNSDQTPAANSFDGTADILVGKSKTINSTGLPSTPIDINWTRVVAHGLFTLKGFNEVASGETITKVVLTAQEGANLTGKQSASITEGTITATSGSSNSITLEGNNLAFVTEEGKTNLKVWLSVIPVTLTSLKVEVLTNKASYVREITGISKKLKVNACNKLGIDMSTAIKTAETEYVWVKKSLSSIKSSDVFVIVGNNGADYAMSNDKGTSSAPAAVAVTVSGDKLTSSPSDKLQWTLSKDGDNYTFYPYGTTDTWLYCFNNNNGLRVGTNPDKVFVIDQGYLKHVVQNRYIGIYNSSDWRSYTSISNNIKDQVFSFFVRSAGDEPVLNPVTIEFDKPVTTVNISGTVTNVATINPSNLTISYSSSNEEVATVTDAGVVTGVSAGTAIITATFAGDDNYDSNSASYVITVVDPNANDGSAGKPYTASEAATLAMSGNTDNVYVKGYISSIVEEYSSYGNTSFNISEDGSTTATQFEIFRVTATSASDYVVGDYVVFQGNLTKYNSTPELAQGGTNHLQVKAPRFNPDGGNFSGDSQSIILAADPGAEIRYTIGETVPTSTTGTVYSEAIAITATTKINALAVSNGIVTGVVSKTFTKIVGADVQFVTSDFSGQGTTNTGSEIKTTKSGISFICDKGFGTTQIRCYKGSTITISAEDGKTITGISFVFSGDYNGGLNTSYSNLSTSSWTSGELGSQARFTSITVTYK